MRSGWPRVNRAPAWLILSSTLLTFRCIKHAVGSASPILRDTTETDNSDIQDNSEAEELEEAAGARMCPDLDDDNGRWEGSRIINGKYQLTCAPGFKVHGRGNRSSVLTCPESLKWTEDVWCENIDDCAQLKHGCGALGVCIDKVMGYECNCEQGYGNKHSQDGEIVCGSKHWNSVICGGNTCGSYGVCIDLTGDTSSFDTFKDSKPKHNGSKHHESNKSERVESSDRHHEKSDRHHEKSKSTKAGLGYRCECIDGFRDNGETCVRLNCGTLQDTLGVWQGSTEYGGEYTLTCPTDTYVWGGALREVTISCPEKGAWLSKPVCISPLREALDAQFATFRFWFYVFLALVCVCSAAAAAGLTLGVATLEPFRLNVICETDIDECNRQDERDKLQKHKACANVMRDVVRGDHRLMVTLFVFNTIANEALPIFLDELTTPIVSVLLSVSVVLIFGEIVPSAICTGSNQFFIAAKSVPFVKTLEYAFCVVAKPIGLVLDYYLETSDSFQKYSRHELKALLQLHVQEEKEEAENSEQLATMARQESARSNSSTAEDERHHQHLPPLTKSELHIMQNMWQLSETHLQPPRARRLKSFNYWSIKECLKAHVQDTPVDVLSKSLPFKVRQRAVLVLNDESGSGATGWHDKPVLADVVHGILQLQQLLSGGNEQLHKLCHGRQPPTIYEDATLIEVLRELGTNLYGMVVQKPTNGRGRTEVKGLVCRSEVLASLTVQNQPGLGRDPTSRLGYVSEAEEGLIDAGPAKQPVKLRATRGARLNRAPSMPLARESSPAKSRPVSGGVFSDLSPSNKVHVEESYSRVGTGDAGGAWRDPIV